MLAAGSFLDILSNLDLWRGVGRFLIDAFLVYALLMIVLSVSGHPPKAWPFSGLFSRTGTSSAVRAQPDPRHNKEHTTAGRVRTTPTTERHLEYLDQLSTALKYQGSTVVLIVFAVILLGFQRVLAGPEVATILSGIAGFVLGQTKSSTPPAPHNGGGVGGSGGGDVSGHPDADHGGAGGSAPDAPAQV